MRRATSLQLVGDYQIFRKKPALRLSAEFGYYQVTAGNNELHWLTINGWRGQPFFEQVQMNYAHAGVGILIEPFGKKSFSPYLGWQLQFAFPDQLEYHYKNFAGAGLSPKDQVYIKGGEEVARGWKLNFGFRAELHSRWALSFGMYHCYMDFYANWPPFEQRQVLDAIMRVDGGGFEIRCQYSI